MPPSARTAKRGVFIHDEKRFLLASKSPSLGPVQLNHGRGPEGGATDSWEATERQQKKGNRSAEEHGSMMSRGGQNEAIDGTKKKTARELMGVSDSWGDFAVFGECKRRKG